MWYDCERCEEKYFSAQQSRLPIHLCQGCAMRETVLDNLPSIVKPIAIILAVVSGFVLAGVIANSLLGG
jgi:hypothetical protein